MLSSYGIVLYIDVFGFSSLVEKEQNEELTKKLLGVWKWIKVEIIDKNRKYKIKRFFFSDSLFLLYPLEIYAIEEIIQICFEHAQELMNEYLKRDLFVRGGISIGNITYSHNLLLGKPVVEAVKYESKLCFAPFIILPILELERNITGKKREHIIQFLKEPDYIKTKNNGYIKCHCIFPTDLDLYHKKIQDKIEYHTINGPFELSNIWLELLALIQKLKSKQPDGKRSYL